MSLKITFHFHPNVVMGTQIQKSMEQNILVFMKVRCVVTRCRCCIVSDQYAEFPACEGTWLRTPLFLDNKGILHTADRILQTLKYARSDKSNTMQKDLTLDK